MLIVQHEAKAVQENVLQWNNPNPKENTQILKTRHRLRDAG